MLRKVFCSLTLCALLLCSVAAPVLAANDDRYVIVETSGKGKDRNAAIENAWQEAIRQAAGVFIDSKTELNDNQLTERIISYSRALVEKYEVIEADESRADEGIYRVKMRLWVVRDVLRDGVQVATNKTAKVSFSADDLKPAKEDLKPTELEARDARTETGKAKAETGVELLSAMLDRYKPEDFINVRMVGKVTPVKGAEDLCQVLAEVSFNDQYYYEAFVPDLKQVLDQISTRKKDVTLTKQKDTLRRITGKKGAPLADSSIVLRGNDLGKDFSLAVYDKPDRFGCRLYAFSKDDADKILNNLTGVLAQFRGRIATIRGFQIELQDESGEAVDTAEQEITLPFLLTDSVVRDNVWAFHPTLMGYAGMYNYVPLYMENAVVTIPLRFELTEELQQLVRSIEATPVLDDSLAQAALQTRQACHQTALTFLTAGENVAQSVFSEAADAGYPLARVALESIEAAEIWKQRGDLLLDEVVDRLKPAADAGNAAAIYDTFRRLEDDAANFENQKRSVPYLTMAAMVHPEAMIRMGEIQEQGFYGVKPDKKKADLYYKEGTRILSMLASQGLPCAAVALGHVYLEGLGTKQDTPRAERYYNFAVKAGYEDPEFWFWENYGIAMRQVQVPKEFFNYWERFVNTNWDFRDLREPRTCMYLIREKETILMAWAPREMLVDRTPDDFFDHYFHQMEHYHKGLGLSFASFTDVNGTFMMWPVAEFAFRGKE